MKTLYILCLLFTLLVSSCTITSNVNSFHNSNEEVRIVPIEASADEAALLPIAPLAAAFAPGLITLATSQLEGILDRAAETYIASYGSMYVGEDFYESDTSLSFSYRAFEVNRYVDADGNRQPASSIRLGWIANAEHSLFALMPEKIQVHKAKARMKSGDHHLDLSIHIVLNAFWQQKNGEIKSKELGDVSLLLTGIRLGETYTLKGEPNNFYLEDSNGRKSNYNVMTPWIAPVPVSVSDQGNRMEDARGNFTLGISVTEVDDYGSRVARFGKALHDNRGLLIEAADQLLDP